MNVIQMQVWYRFFSGIWFSNLRMNCDLRFLLLIVIGILGTTVQGWAQNANLSRILNGARQDNRQPLDSNASRPLDHAPAPAYYLARAAFNRGDCDRAIELLSEINSPTAASPVRHQLGEIAVRALLAECFRENNDLVAAGQQYQLSLEAAAAHPAFLRWVPWNLIESNLAPQANAENRTGGNLSTDLATARAFRLPQVLRVANAFEDDPSGLDVFETMRMLALASYRRRWLMGRDWASQSPLASQVLAATVHPGVVGTNAQFNRSGTLISALRRVLQYHAGDNTLARETESMAMIESRSHPLSAVLLLTQLRCQAMQSKEAPHQRSTAELMRQVSIATWASEAAVQHHQYAVAAEIIELATELCADDIHGRDLLAESEHATRRSLLLQLEQRTDALSKQIATVAPAASCQLRLTASELALLSDEIQRAEMHLRTSQHLQRSSRINSPRLTLRTHAIGIAITPRQMIVASNQPDGDQAALRRLGVLQVDYRNHLQSFVQILREQICHPLAYRDMVLPRQITRQFDQLTETQRRVGVAFDPATLITRAMIAPSASQELSNLDQLAASLNTRSESTRTLIRLAVRQGHSDRVLLGIDRLLSNRARRATELLGTPASPAVVNDLRWLTMQSQKSNIELKQLFPEPSRVPAKMGALQPIADAPHEAVGASAEVIRLRREAQLAQISIEHVQEIPRCVPPPCDLAFALNQLPGQPRQPGLNDRKPSLRRGIQPGIAVLTMTVLPGGSQGTSDSHVMTLTTAQQTSHWEIPNRRRTEELSRRWLTAIAMAALATDANSSERTAQRMDAAMDLSSRLFPPLCGIRHEIDAIEHLIVVPDGVLWFLPIECLPISDATQKNNNQETDWREKLRAHYSPTPGYAMALARELSRESLPEELDEMRASRSRQIGVLDLNLSGKDEGETDSTVWPNETITIDRWDDPVLGTPAWWGQAIGHLVIRLRSRAMNLPIGVTNALQSDVSANRIFDLSPGMSAAMHSTVAIQGNSRSRIRSDVDWFSEANARSFFAWLCLIHASGTRHAVVNRWPCDDQITKQFLGHWAPEVSQTSFDEAFDRSIALFGRQDFTWSGWPDLVGSRRAGAALPLAGDHPIIGETLLHIRNAASNQVREVVP